MTNCAVSEPKLRIRLGDDDDDRDGDAAVGRGEDGYAARRDGVPSLFGRIPEKTFNSPLM